MDAVAGGAGADVVEQLIRIEARPEVVSAYLVDPERLVRWMGREATLDPRPGGLFRLVYPHGDVVRGEVVAIRPPESLAITWGWEMDGDPTPPGASKVEFTLVADGTGTLLRLRHSGLPEVARVGHTEGWSYFLPRLAEVLAGPAAAG